MTPFYCLKATEPLRGQSFLFPTNTPGVSGTHLIDLEGWKAESIFARLSFHRKFRIWSHLLKKALMDLHHFEQNLGSSNSVFYVLF